MKKAKRYLMTAGLAAAIMAMPMTAYGGIFKKAQTEVSQTETVKYEFKSGETTIAMGAEAGEVMKALGNPVKPVFEQESCAYQGKDKVYTYSGFEVSTYPSGKKEYISSVYLLDSTVATPEGVKIGSKEKDVVDAYGKDYDKEEVKFGTYAYTTDTALLKIYTTKGVVDGIEYLVNVKK